MIHSIEDAIIVLNYIRKTNISILNLISTGDINLLIDINLEKVPNTSLIDDIEFEKIKDFLRNNGLEKYKEELYRRDIKYVTVLDENYPIYLKDIYNAPSILYYKGKMPKRMDNVLSIVGTRKPTEYGVWATKKIIHDLRSYDIQIASGMALGIDGIAHDSAIKHNLSSIGVLASSADVRYPKTNDYLYDKMDKQLLLSEFPLNTQPIKRNFLQRNRIISGIAFGTLVIEAMDKSGSLITANYALEQNRQVFAIPGNINSIHSEGTNKLISQGAKLVSSVNDIIEEISFIKEIDKIKMESSYKLDENSMKVVDLLKNNILPINDIANVLNIDLGELYKIIYNLKNMNIIQSINNDMYTLI